MVMVSEARAERSAACAPTKPVRIAVCCAGTCEDVSRPLPHKRALGRMFKTFGRTNLRNRFFSNNLVWNCNSKVVRNSDSTRDCSKTMDFANSLRIYACVPCDRLFWTPIPLAFRTQQGLTRRRLLLTHPLVEVPTNCAIGRGRAPASSDIL